MKYNILILPLLFLLNCNKSIQKDISGYHQLINQAELTICEEDFKSVSKLYKTAFSKIEKPFGKDVFNAALICGKTKDKKTLKKYLQKIIDNTDDFDFTKSEFVDKYISEEEWAALIEKRKIDYNEALRKEFDEIIERDQIFRPMYDAHDDTINTNRKINLARILELEVINGLTSHRELGYTERFRNNTRYIVLHHTAQRRSYDKSVMDLEELLKKAVAEGRLDPELAIFYMEFQNDMEKGRFQVCTTWQFTSPLLPDSLNSKIWINNFSQEEGNIADELRNKWLASDLESALRKTKFLSENQDGFIFTSVLHSIVEIHEKFDEAETFSQYQMMTGSHMKEYK